MMEELANIITCVTGDARQRRTIYEADQDFERFGKTLITNFKDTTTLWAFLRASLLQCHIHKLSKVGKDKAAWSKTDEYLTNLMDSDTMLSSKTPTMPSSARRITCSVRIPTGTSV